MDPNRLWVEECRAPASPRRRRRQQPPRRHLAAPVTPEPARVLPGNGASSRRHLTTPGLGAAAISVSI